ncbi:hypothetical protein [Streptomyces sp. NPDC126499]|uniref:hypothetical protein n=1 Tax=Streptomyces sp. NPDC126499 TaxID=3155314 RepID=UPI003319F145
MEWHQGEQCLGSLRGILRRAADEIEALPGSAGDEHAAFVVWLLRTAVDNTPS